MVSSTAMLTIRGDGSSASATMKHLVHVCVMRSAHAMRKRVHGVNSPVEGKRERGVCHKLLPLVFVGQLKPASVVATLA